MDEYGFEQLFNPEILRRGKEYYRSGAVKSIKRQGGLFEGDVLGSSRYHVAVRLCEDGIDEMYCDCQHASSGRNCKHMAAFLYAVCEKELPSRL